MDTDVDIDICYNRYKELTIYEKKYLLGTPIYTKYNIYGLKLMIDNIKYLNEPYTILTDVNNEFFGITYRWYNLTYNDYIILNKVYNVGNINISDIKLTESYYDHNIIKYFTGYICVYNKYLDNDIKCKDLADFLFLQQYDITINETYEIAKKIYLEKDVLCIAYNLYELCSFCIFYFDKESYNNMKYQYIDKKLQEPSAYIFNYVSEYYNLTLLKYYYNFCNLSNDEKTTFIKLPLITIYNIFLFDLYIYCNFTSGDLPLIIMTVNDNFLGIITGELSEIYKNIELIKKVYNIDEFEIKYTTFHNDIKYELDEFYKNKSLFYRYFNNLHFIKYYIHNNNYKFFILDNKLGISDEIFDKIDFEIFISHMYDKFIYYETFNDKIIYEKPNNLYFIHLDKKKIIFFDEDRCKKEIEKCKSQNIKFDIINNYTISIYIPEKIGF